MKPLYLYCITRIYKENLEPYYPNLAAPFYYMLWLALF
jgi:hypothetical protein